MFARCQQRLQQIMPGRKRLGPGGKLQPRRRKRLSGCQVAPRQQGRSGNHSRVTGNTGLLQIELRGNLRLLTMHGQFRQQQITQAMLVKLPLNRQRADPGARQGLRHCRRLLHCRNAGNQKRQYANNSQPMNHRTLHLP